MSLNNWSYIILVTIASIVIIVSVMFVKLMPGILSILLCVSGILLMFYAHYACAFRYNHSGIFFIWKAGAATSMSLNKKERRIFILGLVISMSAISSIVLKISL